MGSLETVRHFLVDCPGYEDLRIRLLYDPTLSELSALDGDSVEGLRKTVCFVKAALARRDQAELRTINRLTPGLSIASIKPAPDMSPLPQMLTFLLFAALSPTRVPASRM